DLECIRRMQLVTPRVSKWLIEGKRTKFAGLVQRVMEELTARRTSVMSLMVEMEAIRKVMYYRVQNRGLMVRVTAYQHSDGPSRVLLG
ncbi:hypothetical protein HAX54_027412, partial [Datura stramonium]|nr:hypothetical protein [Datura stramonium]